MKFTAKCVTKALASLSIETAGKCSLQQLLIKPDQCIGNRKSAQMDLIIRKKLHVVMHKCHTVQFLFRQHGSLGALKMHDLKMTDKENYGSGKCKSGK